MRRPLAAAMLALTAAACTSEQATPAASRTRLAVTQPAADHTITFEAESRDGTSSLASVTYSVNNPAGDLLVHQSEDRIELPFTKTVEQNGPVGEVSMWLFNKGADDVLICRIRVDGKLLDEESSKGYFNNAFCQVPGGQQ